MRDKQSKVYSYKVVKENKLNGDTIYTLLGGKAPYSIGALNTRSVNTLIAKRIIVLVETTKSFYFYKYLDKDGKII